jgi:mannitol/fructose-specific phosphotransferase system IIA component (Ntr-type)
MNTRAVPAGGLEDGVELESPRNIRRVRDELLAELAELLDLGGNVSNPRRLARDLVDREQKTRTGLGQGLAIPHARTLQMRSFSIAFGRSPEGLPFEAPDGEPVHLFFAMAAPPHDDRTYLKVYRSLAKSLLEPDTIDALLELDEPGEVLRLLRQFGG